MAYSLEQYQDLVTTTLRKFEKNVWEDIVVDKQEFIAMPMILQKKRVSFGDGTGIHVEVRVGTNNPARNVKLNEPDNPTVTDMMAYITGNYRNSTTYWAAEERELKANRGASRIVELLKVKKHDAMVSLAELMETNWFGKPTDSNDVVTPRGLFYWIVKASGTPSFQGGIPSGFTDVGGLSPTTYPRWKNWTGQYVTFSKADGIRKIREAMDKTTFKPPVEFPSVSGESKSGPKPSDWALLTTYAVKQTAEDLLSGQNDDLGLDLAYGDGQPTIRRTPITWAPALDVDTSNPIYGVNWRTWKVYFMEGEYMNEGPVMRMPNQHRSIVQYTDCTYDFICTNRRRNFVLYV